LESEQLIQRARAFNYLFDAVVVTDSLGIIVDWNKGSEALYGYSEDEVVGQSVSLLHVPEDVDHITSQVLAAVADEGKWTGEVRMLHKDGSIGWIESICIPILDDDNVMVGALGINRDITKRINETEHLRHIAQYDQLTGIPNRYLLLDRIDHLIAQYERNNTAFTLLYFDLDKFKQMNDDNGHSFGDQVLKTVAERINCHIRKSDMVARIGGDEFVVLLENTGKHSDIETAIKTITNAINQGIIIDGKTLTVDCSIGRAIYPKDGSDSDKLLSHADKDMYNIKRNR
jgi:diguanylate cyclase (GGDEF)-like protein/PAS domain S-box-containing protein